MVTLRLSVWEPATLFHQLHSGLLVAVLPSLPLMTKDAKHLLVCLLAIVSFLWE
jgi:hypothetical protein